MVRRPSKRPATDGEVRATPAQRTTVIMLGQIAAIVALVAIWSVVRRRPCLPNVAAHTESAEA